MAGYNPLDADSDPFRPPAIPTLVGCLHCGQEYESYLIEWRVLRDHEGQPHGFWCCPIPGCDGKGFGCDIFPLDPEYRDEQGNKMWCDDESEDATEEELFSDDAEPEASDMDAAKGDPPDDQDEALPW